MADNSYDEACRYLAKCAGGAMVRWMLGLSEADVAFDALVESAQVLPGTKERICDAVAAVRDQRRGGFPCAVIIEFQITPDAEMFGRLLVAGGMVWLGLKPSEHRGDRYDLVAVVVNLTGKGNCARDVIVGTAQWKLTPRELNLEELDAEKVLADVAAGAAPKELLAWIPLMQKGNEDVIIERWLEIARQEPDLKRRGDYSLATLFAGAVGQQQTWKKRLEGLTMIESPVVAEWRQEGERKGRIESLLRVLRRRFKAVPPDLETKIRACEELDQMDRWMDAAVDVTTLDEFRQQGNV
jgi:hypothetical protein